MIQILNPIYDSSFIMSVRQATAAALRAAGLSTDSIAAALGLTADEVEKLIAASNK